MANAPFDMVIINPLEGGVADDVDRLQSQLRRTLLDMLVAMQRKRTSLTDPTGTNPPSGFFGDGFRVIQGVGMDVKLRPGIGLIYDSSNAVASLNSVTGLDDLSNYRALVLLSELTFTGVPNGDGANPRIDIVEVKSPRRVTDPTSRLVLDPTTYTESAQLVNKTVTWTADGQQTVNGVGYVNYKTGVAAGAPVAPAVTAGYTKIAEIWVPALDAAITQNQIVDLRSTLSPNASVCSARVILFGGGAPPQVFRVNAPPGWILAADIDAFADYKFELHLIAGSVQSVTATATTIGHMLGTMRIAEVSTVTTYVPAPASTAAVYTSAARFNPTHNINDGSRSAIVGVSIQELTGGAPSAPAPASYPIAVDVKLLVEV